MKIETLIDVIKTDKSNGEREMPPGVTEAVTTLVSRLEGMLPEAATAASVAKQLGVTLDLSRDSSATFAWAALVWKLYHAGRIAELLPVVLPLLPVGQPFGQSEIGHVRGEALLAEVKGDKTTLASARGKWTKMAHHNATT